tara:strand:+ start:151 stop:309 length:159 start_codon:yes stop_codon:yes gene_type:complete
MSLMEERETKYDGDENSTNVETININDPKYEIRPDKARFPVSIVWTNIPIIS